MHTGIVRPSDEIRGKPNENTSFTAVQTGIASIANN
jgi:hypothetical protein